MKAILTATLLSVAALSVSVSSASTADIKTLIYGCTSDGKPARIRVWVPLKDRKTVQAAFRQVIGGRTSEWFLLQKRTPFGKDWQNALAELDHLSRGKLPKQNPIAVANSVTISTRDSSKRRYCSG
jgi:hypothetical protein